MREEVNRGQAQLLSVNEVDPEYVDALGRMGAPLEIVARMRELALTSSRAVIHLAMIRNLEHLLAQAPWEATRELGNDRVRVPTQDASAPDLPTFGYESKVEIDPEVNKISNTVDIAITLHRMDPDSEAGTISITNADGITRSAKVNPFGVAFIEGVPITDNLAIVWRRQ